MVSDAAGINIGTAFCVRNLRSEGQSLSLWATTLHGIDCNDCVIWKRHDDSIKAKVAYTNYQDDVAILVAPLTHFEGCNPLFLESATEQGKAVTVYGHHTHGSTEEISALNATICATDAHSSNGPQVLRRWLTHHFCLLDRTCDFGTSGAPVVARDGHVVAMVVASAYVGISAALSATYVQDATSAAEKKITSTPAPNTKSYGHRRFLLHFRPEDRPI